MDSKLKFRFYSIDLEFCTAIIIPNRYEMLIFSGIIWDVYRSSTGNDLDSDDDVDDNEDLNTEFLGNWAIIVDKGYSELHEVIRVILSDRKASEWISY